MAIDITTPADGTPAEKAKMRANWQEIDNRIGTLPGSYVGLAGQVITVQADETGPDVPDGPVNFNRQAVKNFGPTEIVITTSITLDGGGGVNSHNGCLLKCVTGTIALTVQKAGSPVVAAGFYCQLWNAGSGSLSLTFGAGLTNSNPTGHHQVQPGRKAELYVSADGSTVFFDGATL